ncbi:uncharacterized protein LOC143041676 [Oratosquilla oratoria]|uniref:uncharacterized protein LOC143041676 n=1 Tax=Oratosquilla oratoria TaxID=337810 RepID=UPI003F758E29
MISEKFRYHSTIQRLGREIKEHKEQVMNRLDWGLLVKFEDKITSVSRFKASKKRSALDQKLERLVDNEKKGTDRWVRNFSGRPLSEAEHKVLSKDQRGGTISSSDKGRSTVVLDRSEYEFKAVTLLQDANTYEVVEADPIQKLQRKVEGELRKLKESRLISEREWMLMKPGDSVIPKMYGLPKIHKEGVPLRPIIAFRGSPTYNLAKALAKRLRPVVEKSERMLKNSTDFVDRLRGISLEEGDILVSFDVKSMFTSLPQDLLKQAVLSKVEGSEEFRDNEKLSTEELVRLVNLCLDSTFFRFREKVYHQRIGTPMGSPISVVLAEMAMQEFEEEMLAAAPVALKTWMRYVDDVFVIMKEDVGTV